MLAAVVVSAASPVESGNVRIFPERLAGGTVGTHGTVFTWGDRLRLWNSAKLTSRVIAEGPFGEGGCTADLDRDGRLEIVSVRGSGLGQLLWLKPPGWTVERIDDEMEVHDCLEATLFGRRGILVIQRGMQVRFYERAAGNQWKSRDIYSIYTPSYQSGLALADIDKDGRPDILCGNYWIRSPETWEQSWRIFAINTWSENQESAMFRIVELRNGAAEIVAQSHSSPGRLAVFTRPGDVTLQWPVRMLAPEMQLANIHGLAISGDVVFAGENDGPRSRLLRVNLKSGVAETLATGRPVLNIINSGKGSFLTVEPHRIALWQNRVSPSDKRRHP